MRTKLKHFKMSEFKCPCCGQERMDMGFVYQLDIARDRAGIPFRINSGMRCHQHNLDIGGVLNSSHTKGKAADIATDSSHKRYLIIDSLIMTGFRRIGIAKTYIHVDNDLSKPDEVVWLYK